MNRRACLALSVALLFACATTTPPPRERGFWALPAPDSLGQSLTAFLQVIVYQPVDTRQLASVAQLQVGLEVGAGRLQLVVLSPLGQRLATIRWREGRSEVSLEPGAPPSLPYRELLPAIQLVFWPLAALQRAAADTPWRFAESGTRRVWYDAQLIADSSPIGTPGPSPWNGRHRYSNHGLGLQFVIHSVLLDATAP